MPRQSHLIALVALVLGCGEADESGDATACPPAELGESCDDRPCVVDARCHLDEEICIEGLQEGEPCGGIVPCAVGLTCDASERICVAAAGLDEACSGHGQCETGYCPAGFCAELPVEDEPCFDFCADGLVCDSNTKVCFVPPWSTCGG